MLTGYEINMRQDNRTGEHLAFIPSAYKNMRGDRYYMAFTLADGWVELTPEYATRSTRTVSEFCQKTKRAADSNLGRILNLYPRLAG